MLDLLDLVQLQDLGDPPLTLHQAALRANFVDFFPQRAKVDRNIFRAGEHICQKTGAPRQRRRPTYNGKGGLPGQQGDVVCHQLRYNSLGDALNNDDLFGDGIREPSCLFRAARLQALALEDTSTS